MSELPNDPNRSVPYLEAIPRSTPWPMITAFGVTFVFAGIVTSPMVSVVGAIASIVGLVGWFRDVLPAERTEAIPIDDAATPLAPVELPDAPAISPRRIVPEEIHPYRSGVLGGLAGAVAMAVVAIGWGLFGGRGPWLPVNLLAGILVPSVGDADPATLGTFNAGWFVTATLLHLVLSVLVGTIFVVALPMMPKRPLLAGGLLAPIIWTGVAWATLRIVNPTLEDYISWPWFIASQMAFGLACAAVIARFNLVRLQVGRSLADRLELEQGRSGDAS
ncbi:MAG: hypothetical protein VX672_06375 [Planctomycetota bacterium]|nr:hypothetical protein [Planctomycetota bacterium]